MESQWNGEEQVSGLCQMSCTAICIHLAVEVRITGALPASLKPLRSVCPSDVKEEGTLEGSLEIMKAGDWVGLRHNSWA